jgi:hypothetical protein
MDRPEGDAGMSKSDRKMTNQQPTTNEETHSLPPYFSTDNPFTFFRLIDMRTHHPQVNPAWPLLPCAQLSPSLLLNSMPLAPSPSQPPNIRVLNIKYTLQTHSPSSTISFLFPSKIIPAAAEGAGPLPARPSSSPLPRYRRRRPARCSGRSS